MPRETVLITGASSGIGRELAGLFAADGAELVLVARSADRLEALAEELRAAHGTRVRILPHDLANPETPREILAALSRSDASVDVVVNNAGFGARGTVAELPVQRQLEMIQVNVSALTHLTRLFLPGMLERGHGGILNVASTAAFQPGPLMSVYFASKAYVLHFTEGLAEETAGSGLKISCLAPGPTHTEFESIAGMEGTRLFQRGVMSAREVAEQGYAGFRQGKTVVVPGARNRALAFAVRLAPRALIRKITASLQK